MIKKNKINPGETRVSTPPVSLTKKKKLHVSLSTCHGGDYILIIRPQLFVLLAIALFPSFAPCCIRRVKCNKSSVVVALCPCLALSFVSPRALYFKGRKLVRPQTLCVLCCVTHAVHATTCKLHFVLHCLEHAASMSTPAIRSCSCMTHGNALQVERNQLCHTLYVATCHIARHVFIMWCAIVESIAYVCCCQRKWWQLALVPNVEYEGKAAITAWY